MKTTPENRRAAAPERFILVRMRDADAVRTEHARCADAIAHAEHFARVHNETTSVWIDERICVWDSTAGLLPSKYLGPAAVGRYLVAQLESYPFLSFKLAPT